MSKQKRNAGSRTSASEAGGSDKEGPSVEQSNQAVLEQLGTADHQVAEAFDVEAVRSVAQGLVERGLFALDAEPREAAVIDKYVDVLRTSALPSDRKAVLIEKLTTDQEAALGARAAAERCFGDVEAGRAVLDQVWNGLSSGQHPPAAATAAESAERWIADLSGGSDAASFCHEVQLLLALDEEEEEEGTFGSFTVEMD